MTYEQFKSEKRFHFYDPSRVKSYNKYINFIVGGRGIGKRMALKRITRCDHNT